MPRITLEGLLKKHGKFHRYLRPGDFTSGDMALLESCLGSDIAFVLAAEMGGVQMTLSKNALLPMKRRYIHANFNGSNQKQLAIDCELSLSAVYKILREEPETAADPSPKKEKTLFDFIDI